MQTKMWRLVTAAAFVAALLASITASAKQSTPTEAPYRLVDIWDDEASIIAGNPRSIAVGGEQILLSEELSTTGSRIAVFDPQGHVVNEFDMDATDVIVEPSGDMLSVEWLSITRRSPDGALLDSWGEPWPPEALINPRGVATDSNNRVYVLDDVEYQTFLVKLYSGDGSYLGVWGDVSEYVNDPYGLPYPMAVDKDGNLYLIEYDRVLKFGATGNFIKSWGEYGDGPGQFGTLNGVAISNSGLIYLADTGNERIQIFTRNGKYVEEWECPTPDNESQCSLLGVAVDENGSVYAVDGTNHRVLKFDADGQLLTEWPVLGLDSSGWSPLDLVVSRDGYVYVLLLDAPGYVGEAIQKYTPDGDFLAEWNVGLQRQQGHWCHPGSQVADIAIDGNSNLFVADSLSRTVQKYTGDGAYEREWGSRLSGQLQAIGVASDVSGNVYVADCGFDRIQKFTRDGGYLTEWGTSGALAGEFNGPVAVAVDKDNYVYVVDYGNNRLQKFTSEGDYVTQWGGLGDGPGQLDQPVDIAIGQQGHILVADSGNDRVQQFTAGGQYLAQWGNSDPGRLVAPSGVATDEKGVVYVVDSTRRIHKFNDDGIYRTSWGQPTENQPRFSATHVVMNSEYLYTLTLGSPYSVKKYTLSGNFVTRWEAHGGSEEYGDIADIALDSHGNVYVADTRNCRVQKYNGNGDFLTEWTGNCEGEGQFQPTSITLDGDNNVYVTEGNSVMKFDADGTPLAEWVVPDSSLGFIPNTVAYDKVAGRLYVLNGYRERVVVFTSSGEYVTEWPLQNALAAWGISVDGDGNVFIAEYFGSKITQYTATGTYVTGWGERGRGPGQFGYLYDGPAISPTGLVYVADPFNNNRLQVFAAGYPAVDPHSGLIVNGSFEGPGFDQQWSYGASPALPVSVVDGVTTDGQRAIRLGRPTPQAEQESGHAWLIQTIHIPADWERPVLDFDYRVQTNDTVDYSDFVVGIKSLQGWWLADVLRDGFRPCISPPTAPPAGYDLGWQHVTYDLSDFRGQSIKLWFEVRNLHHDLSFGVWTYIDDVRVLDARTQESLGDAQVYLPAVQNLRCDPVPATRSMTTYWP